jgi:3-deoxy-D-manno-octulosonate 8-phosphate phosphatase (KDO 8-P phosphatase)
MFGPADLEARYTALGGRFLTPATGLATRAASLSGLVFDWDGVFNSGVKGDGVASTFSEADSMGTNLLRYALWRRAGELPFAAIVSGADNPGARRLAEREHFDAVYTGVRDKGAVIGSLAAARGLGPDGLLCVFDDVNDLPMAAGCAIRVLVRRAASPLLAAYAERERLCDYITAFEGGYNAVREVTELVIGLLGAFEAVVRSRVASDEQYARYFAARQAVETEINAN